MTKFSRIHTVSTLLSLFVATVPLEIGAQEQVPSAPANVSILPPIPDDVLAKAEAPSVLVSSSPKAIQRPAASGLDTFQAGTFYGTPMGHPSPYYILPRMSVQPLYLGASWNSSTLPQWQTWITNYLKYVLPSSYVSSLAPYGVLPGSAKTGLVSLTSLPYYSSTKPVYLQDSTIKSYLTYFLQHGQLSANDTIAVFTDPGVAISFDSTNTQTSRNAFLGYHSSFTWVDSRGTTHFSTYLVIPWPGYPNFTPTSQGFSSYGDMISAVTSHEVAEAATDPYCGNNFFGWTEKIYGYDLNTKSYQLAYSGVSGEVGDAAKILYPAYKTIYCRLNGYLLQKLIATNGTSLITPSGAAAPTSALSQVQPILKSIDQHLSIYGLELPLP